MENNKEIRIKFSPGCWEYYFRNKNTLERLTPIDRMVFSGEAELTFDIPDEIINNKDAVFITYRVR